MKANVTITLLGTISLCSKQKECIVITNCKMINVQYDKCY